MRQHISIALLPALALALLLTIPYNAYSQAPILRSNVALESNWWEKAPFEVEKLSNSPYTFDEEYLKDNPNIYIPKKTGKLPTVIVVHGFMGSKAQMDDVAKLLARHGMLVFSYTAQDQGQPFQWLDGLIAAYQILEGENARPGSPLYNRVDLGNVALLGHSMGGAGVLHSAAMAWPNGLRGKIKTAVGMMPYHGTVSAFTDNFAGGKDKLGCDIKEMPYPVLIISGQVDTVNEPVGGYDFFQTATAKGTVFMSFKGTNHTDWMNEKGLINSKNFPYVMPVVTAWLLSQLTNAPAHSQYFVEESNIFKEWVKPHLQGNGKEGDKKYFPPYRFKR